MSATLVLIGGSTPEASLIWVRVGAGGAMLERGVIAAGRAMPQAASSNVVLVLPGTEAQIRILDQPANSEAQARAAAAYLFRGSLAAESEQVVFAIGDRSEAGRRMAAAFDKQRIDHWLARCAEVGVRPSTIHLDCALWPCPAGVVQIAKLDDRTIVAGGNLGGFTIETALAAALIQPWLAKLPEKPAEVQTIGFDAAELAIARPDMQIAAGKPADPIEVLAHAAAAPPPYAPTLRMAEFEDAGRTVSPLRPWRLVAGLAVFVILLQAGIATYDGVQDSETARRVSASAESEFHQIRPDVKRIVNLRAQVSAALNAAEPPRANPVISASDVVARTLQAHAEIRLDEMRFEAASKMIAVRLSGPQADVLDAAVADLRNQSAGLEIGQMETSAGRVSVAVTMVAS